MTASGTYAITGLLLVVAAAALGWSQVEIVTVDTPNTVKIFKLG